MGSPGEQGSLGSVMLNPPELRDGLKCGGMRSASQAMMLSRAVMPPHPSRACSGDVLGPAGVLAWE